MLVVQRLLHPLRAAVDKACWQHSIVAVLHDYSFLLPPADMLVMPMPHSVWHVATCMLPYKYWMCLATDKLISQFKQTLL